MSTPADPIDEIAGHVGQALRTTTSAGLQAASVMAMRQQRRASAQAAEHRQHQVEMRQHQRGLEQARRAQEAAARQAAARMGAGPDPDAARWLGAIAAGGGQDLADRAWRSNGWDSLAEELRAREGAGHDVGAVLEKVIPERDFGDGRDVAAVIRWRVERECERTPAQIEGPDGDVAVDAGTARDDMDQAIEDVDTEAAEYERLLDEARLEVLMIESAHLALDDPGSLTGDLAWDQALALAHVELATHEQRLAETQAEIERLVDRLNAGPDESSARWLTAIADAAGTEAADEAWSSMNWPALAQSLDRHASEGHDVPAAIARGLQDLTVEPGADVAGQVHFRVGQQVGADRGAAAVVEAAEAKGLGDTAEWTADDMLVQRRPPGPTGRTPGTRPRNFEPPRLRPDQDPGLGR